jgi:hypothetical protein
MSEASGAGVAATTVAMSEASSYRVKLDKARFLELVEMASPKRIYRRKKNHLLRLRWVPDLLA